MTSTIETLGDVQVLTMDEPRGNALGTRTIEALHARLDEVEDADPGAVVITGRGSVFGVGLDLQQASAFDKAQLRLFVDAFEDFFARLLEFPVPLIAAVNGHALAGGAVLALACDVRVIGEGAIIVALNEVELGIPFPSVAFEIARFGLPPRAHTHAIAFGQRLDPARALALGFAHEQHADPRARALEIARDVAKQGKLAVRAVRHELRAEHVARAKANAIKSRAAFVDAWMAPDAQGRIKAVLDQLAKK